MAHAVVTIALDLDRAGDAERWRRILVRHVEDAAADLALADEGRSVRVTESSVAVDERLGVEPSAEE